MKLCEGYVRLPLASASAGLQKKIREIYQNIKMKKG
jgi:hypothetical protein